MCSHSRCVNQPEISVTGTQKQAAEAFTLKERPTEKCVVFVQNMMGEFSRVGAEGERAGCFKHLNDVNES